MILSAIVAMAQNRVIGVNNQLPWRLSGDLKKFKELTTGHHILMGRKTFESLGRPLPNRTNIVISTRNAFEGAIVVKSLEEGIAIAKKNSESELFIIGGAQIYQSSLALIDRLYITKVLANVDGDAYLPDIDWSKWKFVSREEHPMDDKNQYPWAFEIWERI